MDLNGQVGKMKRHGTPESHASGRVFAEERFDYIHTGIRQSHNGTKDLNIK
jgi:hypothetical protein